MFAGKQGFFLFKERLRCLGKSCIAASTKAPTSRDRLTRSYSGFMGAPLSELRALNKEYTEKFQRQLDNASFALVEIDDPKLLKSLRGGIKEASKLTSFRFPPTDEPIVYNDRQKAAFRSLFDIGIVCLKAVLHDKPSHPRPPVQEKLETFKKALEEVENVSLFESDPNEPFQNENQPFAQSFFNLFNYNHGALNAHVDRSLLTVVFIKEAEYQMKPPTVLWIEDKDGSWHSADDVAANYDAPPTRVVVMAGEQLADWYRAAKHSARVRPYEKDLDNAHLRRDPKTPASGNRLSAALILRHGD